jgi:hypothetical protein
VALGLFAALLIGASGCNTGPKESANQVSGKVTLNGNPVTGSVYFVGADGKESPAGLIKGDGTYNVPDPPQGKVKVLVKGMAGGAGPAAPVKDAPSMPGQSVPPPAKYGAAATTDLETEIKPGKQTYNIELKR